MPNKKAAFIKGTERSVLAELSAALADIGYEVSDTNGNVALIHICKADDEEALLAISSARCPVVAIINIEEPNVLQAVTRAGARGIVDLPIRRSALAVQIELSMVANAHQKRLENKASLLEKTLKSRHVIEKATQVVATLREISQAEAYERLRQASMKRRVTMAEAARDFVASVEAVAKAEEGGAVQSPQG